MKNSVRRAGAGCGVLALSAISLLTGASAASAVDSSTVVVQGGTTPTDSGLLQAVIEPGFKAAYPQYTLKYVSVGTGQAVTNAENGGGDALLTHSDKLEDDFVSKGYSFEPGGRLVMTSDFVTVGPAADPAGVAAGPVHDVVAAYKEIAAAGESGKADFVSRGDASGTNVKEKAIWALAGVALDSAGEPGTPGTVTAASWYHKTGRGQGDNLVVTDQCPFPSGACYTFTDRGTFNTLKTNSSITRLTVLSEENTGSAANGGVSLLTNPYHAYAVNPDKQPNVNLPGALAFLNFLTDPVTQAAIGAFPSSASPAFVPDARPLVAVAGLPRSVVVGRTVTLTGTVRPGFPLDPPLSGSVVEVIRAGLPGSPVASSIVAGDGTWTATFTATHPDTYSVFVPSAPDGLVKPTGISFRQATTLRVGPLKVLGATTAVVAPHRLPIVHGRNNVRINGRAVVNPDAAAPAIRVEARLGSRGFQPAAAWLVLAPGQSTWTIVASLPTAGTWEVRAVYLDPTVVSPGYSGVMRVLVR